MKCSFAKATAFCAEHGMCLDESPVTSSRNTETVFKDRIILAILSFVPATE